MTYKLFTTQTCAYCPMVKKLLEYKDKAFEIVDVTDDYDTRAALQRMYGAQTVPVVVREDGEYMVGYNQAKLMQML